MALRTFWSRRRLQFAPHGVVVYTGWLAVLILIEALGHQAPNDLADLMLLSAIATLVLGAYAAPGLDPARLISRMLGAATHGLRRKLAGGRLIYGIDFRGSPAIPSGLPPWWRRLVLGSVEISALLVLSSFLMLMNIRDAVASYFYLGYLAVLAALWVGLLIATFVNGFLASAVIHDFLVESHHGPLPRPLHGEMGLLTAIGLSIAVAAVLLGPGIPFVVIIAGSAAWIASFLPYRLGFSVLWTERSGEPLRSFDGRWLWSQWCLLFLVTIDVVVLASGDRLWTVGSLPRTTTMPGTLFLGSLLAWTAAATVIVLLCHRWRAVWLTHQLQPHLSRLPTLRIVGDLSREERRAIRQSLQVLGWNGRFGRRALREGEIGVELTAAQWHELRSASGEGHSAELWRKVLGADNLRTWKRRVEVQRRRQLVRGLEKLFKRLAGSRTAGGSGFWIGLQHPFILGMSRDDGRHVVWDRNSTVLDEIIGPPFHTVMTHAARYHYRQISSALQIDLVFVEDGVSLRRFIRVLRMMFEVYDVYGGRMRAEERHFTGLPGVRVIMHDFELGKAERLLKPAFPEPQYEEIGRARILHVFKDRGEFTVQDEVPDAADWTPVGGLA